MNTLFVIRVISYMTVFVYRYTILYYYYMIYDMICDSDRRKRKNDFSCGRGGAILKPKNVLSVFSRQKG